MRLPFITKGVLVNLIFITQLISIAYPIKVYQTTKKIDDESNVFLSFVSNRDYNKALNQNAILKFINIVQYDKRNGAHSYAYYNFIRKYMREIFDSELKIDHDYFITDDRMNITLTGANKENEIYTSELPNISECKHSQEQLDNYTFTQVGVRFSKYLVEPYIEYPNKIFYNIGINSLFGMNAFVGYYTVFGIVGIERKGVQDFNIYVFAFHDANVFSMDETSSSFCNYYDNKPLNMTVCKKRVNFETGMITQFLVDSVSQENMVVDFILGNGSAVNIGAFNVLQDIYDTNIHAHTAFIDTYMLQKICCSNYTNQVYLFDPMYIPIDGVDYGTEYPLNNLFVEAYEYSLNNCNDNATNIDATSVPYTISYIRNSSIFHSKTIYNSMRISRGWNSSSKASA